ncbi:MAG: putative peroxidase-related enzyme [Planctomycetota bacterium]|jgi:uncharacterized peroxidase-related enzyme
MNTHLQNERAEALLQSAEAKFGFVPNLLRELSKSPAALEVYLQGQASLAHDDNVLSPRDKNLVQLVTSATADCKYCTAAHVAMGKGAGSSNDALTAVARGESVSESEGKAFVDATRLLIAKQGNLTGADLAALEAQGIDKATLYEVVGSISVKLLSNWVNHIANTKVDAQFE